MWNVEACLTNHILCRQSKLEAAALSFLQGVTPNAHVYMDDVQLFLDMDCFY